MNRFLADVLTEVNRARAKFPGNKHLLAALMEEVGELANALLEEEYGEGVSSADVYREAVQVAAMAMRIADEGEPGFAKYTPPAEKGKGWAEELEVEEADHA